VFFPVEEKHGHTRIAFFRSSWISFVCFDECRCSQVAPRTLRLHGSRNAGFDDLHPPAPPSRAVDNPACLSFMLVIRLRSVTLIIIRRRSSDLLLPVACWYMYRHRRSESCPPASNSSLADMAPGLLDFPIDVEAVALTRSCRGTISLSSPNPSANARDFGPPSLQWSFAANLFDDRPLFARSTPFADQFLLAPVPPGVDITPGTRCEAGVFSCRHLSVRVRTSPR